MNMKLLIVACVVGTLVAGCCALNDVSILPPAQQKDTSLEWVGLTPSATDQNKLETIFGRYQTARPVVFKVRKYNEGKVVQEWGTMENEVVGCELLSGVKYWLGQSGEPGTKRGTTAYAIRIGLTCNSSWCSIDIIHQTSDQMVSDVQKVVAKYNSPKHRHKNG